MSSRGVHFAITDEQMRQLLRASRQGNEGVLDLMAEIEEDWDERHLVETDKGWEAIHRCLTNDNTPWGELNRRKGSYPLRLCILGGTRLYKSWDWTITLVRPDQVPAVAEALKKVNKKWLRERFFALDPKACRYPITEEEFAYLLSCFKGLPQLFARAAKEGRAVVFSVDH
jgi:hypothetical protein